MKTTDYRWIMYVSQDAFSTSFDVQRVTSLDAARVAYADYCRAVLTDECSATLYPYTEEAWAEAQDFKDAGCPFDYPDRVIRRGAMGGIVVSKT